MDDYHLKLPLVPRAGLEPARAIAHQILSLARLPIPPYPHKLWELIQYLIALVNSFFYKFKCFLFV